MVFSSHAFQVPMTEVFRLKRDLVANLISKTTIVYAECGDWTWAWIDPAFDTQYKTIYINKSLEQRLSLIAEDSAEWILIVFFQAVCILRQVSNLFMKWKDVRNYPSMDKYIFDYTISAVSMCQEDPRPTENHEIQGLVLGADTIEPKLIDFKHIELIYLKLAKDQDVAVKLLPLVPCELFPLQHGSRVKAICDQVVSISTSKPAKLATGVVVIPIGCYKRKRDDP